VEYLNRGMGVSSLCITESLIDLLPRVKMSNRDRDRWMLFCPMQSRPEQDGGGGSPSWTVRLDGRQQFHSTSSLGGPSTSSLVLSVLTTSTTVYTRVHDGSDKHVHASLQLDRARKYR
jgi:hypothetical protein